jgi:hypothetical protein
LGYIQIVTLFLGKRWWGKSADLKSKRSQMVKG